MVVQHLSTVKKILLLQLLVIAVVSGIFAIAQGPIHALHACLGGLAGFIPNVYFAVKVMRSHGQGAKKIVQSFYAGESGKLLLTAALFMLIFQIPAVQFIPLMTGYVSVLSIFWFALILRE